MTDRIEMRYKGIKNKEIYRNMINAKDKELDDRIKVVKTLDVNVMPRC